MVAVLPCRSSHPSEMAEAERTSAARLELPDEFVPVGRCVVEVVASVVVGRRHNRRLSVMYTIVCCSQVSPRATRLPMTTGHEDGADGGKDSARRQAASPPGGEKDRLSHIWPLFESSA